MYLYLTKKSPLYKQVLTIADMSGTFQYQYISMLLSAISALLAEHGKTGPQVYTAGAADSMIHVKMMNPGTADKGGKMTKVPPLFPTEEEKKRKEQEKRGMRYPKDMFLPKIIYRHDNIPTLYCSM